MSHKNKKRRIEIPGEEAVEFRSRPASQASAIDHAVIAEKIRVKANQRLASLDALRGLNMLCIIGLASLIAALCSLHVRDFNVWGDKGVKAATAASRFVSPTVLEQIKLQMDHVGWNGLRHHDTIFPLFLFLAGVSFPFSYRKQLANGRSHVRICLKAIIRGFALFAAGYFYSNTVRFDFPETRFMGVLQHIGLAWMFAAFIYMALANRVRLQVALCAIMLVLYWLVVALVPARDVAPESAFTGEAYRARVSQLLKVRAYEHVFEKQVAEEPLATEEPAGDGADLADAAAEETAEPAAKKRSFKGLLAGMFEDQPLPNPGDPDYPNIGTVDHNLLPEGCVVNYFDRQYVPFRLYHDRNNYRAKIRSGEIDGTYDVGIWRQMRDPEGLASTFPAIVTALLGMLFGGLLRADDLFCSKWRKFRLMIGYGALLLLIGFLWHLVFPINKNLWNSSFVCFVGGYSAIAMGLAYFLIDILPLRWLGFPFAVVGMNSIGIFLIKRIVDFSNARDFFFKDAISRFIPKEYPDPNFVVDPSVVDPGAVEIPMISCGAFQNIATICAGLLVSWLFLYWLYKKRIFFKF